MADALTPLVLTTIQNSYVDVFTKAFEVFGNYAINLFYIIGTIELVLFGLAWAVRQDELLGAFVFKLIKLGFIFFIISTYPDLLQVLINGFTQSAFKVGPDEAARIFFNPGEIWKFGFDTGISMMKLAVVYGTANMGMSMIYIILGFGSLLMFALIGAQIIFVVAGFYIIALLALLFIPLGALNIARNFMDQSVQAVLQAGARVFALILVLGVGVTLWQQLKLPPVSSDTTLEKPLGFFLLTLIIFLLAWRLPKIAERSVGVLKGTIFSDLPTPMPSINIASHSGAPGFGADSSVSRGSSMVGAHAATGVAHAPPLSSNAIMQAATSPVQASMTANVSATSSSGSQSALRPEKKQKGGVGSGSSVEGGISSQTLRKLKATFTQAMQDSK